MNNKELAGLLNASGDRLQVLGDNRFFRACWNAADELEARSADLPEDEGVEPVAPAPVVTEGNTSVSVPDGWQLVPVKPRLGMGGAGWEVIDEQHGLSFVSLPTDLPQQIYRAMLAAAPQPGES